MTTAPSYRVSPSSNLQQTGGKRVAWVAVAGALGAVCRYGVGVTAGPQAFPWPTVAVNVAGCAALGFVLQHGTGRWPADVVTVAAVGFLGAFTTFSTFGYETVVLLRTGRAGTALAYVVLSVALGVGAAALGWTLARP